MNGIELKRILTEATESAVNLGMQKGATLIAEMLSDKPLYVPVSEYAKLWGISDSTVYNLIQNGTINEKNNSLKKGTSGKGRHKYIYRFFDPVLAEISVPLYMDKK